MQGLQKLLVVGVFLIIVYNLGAALWYMYNRQGDEKRTVNALTRRIAVSVGLILVIAVLLYTGVLESHGIRVGR